MTKRPGNMRCGNCRFLYEAGRWGGECRHNAPTLMVEPIEDGRKDCVGRWPRVGSNDWCGRWEPDVEADDDDDDELPCNSLHAADMLARARAKGASRGDGTAGASDAEPHRGA